MVLASMYAGRQTSWYQEDSSEQAVSLVLTWPLMARIGRHLRSADWRYIYALKRIISIISIKPGCSEWRSGSVQGP